MADWFKVYETDLDDELLQWAMTEQPCTGIVYFALLSKCCKEHNQSMPWSTDCALLALSNKVHFGVGLVNDALSLLQRIGMISISGGVLTVNNWCSRQSEYCQRKEKKMSRQCPDNVPTVSPERRGEERSAEKRKKPEAFRNGKCGTPLPGEGVFLKTGDMPHEYQ